MDDSIGWGKYFYSQTDLSWQKAGVINQAIQFNNTSGSAATQYGTINPENSGSQTTVSVWVNARDASPANPGSFVGGPDGYSNIYAYVAVFSRHFQIYVWNGRGSKWHKSITVINPNEWYHFALSFDASTREWKMYVNGNLEKTGIAGYIVTSAKILYLGAFGPNATYKFNGALDEFRFYKQVLTDSQILELYNMKK